MEAILRDMTTTSSETRAFELLRDLIDAIRPRDVNDAQAAINGVQALTYLLEAHVEYRAALRAHLLHLLATRRQVSLYTDTGVFSNESFFSALVKRIGHRLLPPVFNPASLKDLFGAMFHRKNDYVWLEAIPREVWLDLGRSLHMGEETDQDSINQTRLQALEAAQVLSCRLSAIGVEPEIIQNHPDGDRFESPFVRQNVETLAYIEGYRQDMIEKRLPDEDVKPILVLLDQCEAFVSRVRKSAARNGVSVSLTYHLLRISQHIERLRTVLLLLDPASSPEKADLMIDAALTFVRAENRRYALRDVFAENTELLALQVTEHASHTGEHYIADTRAEWGAMFRSAAGAGFVVGFMALFKLLIGKAHLPMLLEALAFGLNYAFGFMLIHMLHCTVATKQPAMTAARIAGAIHQTTRQGKKSVQLDTLTELIVKVGRTQFVAILGNVVVAMPVALLIALAWKYGVGTPVIDADKADHLLHDLNPVASLALFHAAIAGVCLFLSGLISGYYDNKAIYNQIPQRIAALPWLNKLAGEARTFRIARYIENNLGALAGNFYFGMMLGVIGTIGVLLGLPIDIRHITFSSAYLSYSEVTYNFGLDWQVVLVSVAGIALIGLTNLLVSFSLALWVALRARRLSLVNARPLAGKLFRHFLSRPGDFFVPPQPVAEGEKQDAR
ncbi:Site-specific recombinase [Andreprevotia lacus DSM 23236]|jgi:site-specific recombinase|uniref:Site-specific recombinase n=1 Tax=Andreprevotia lacus DSM 23236 TaxID=1121001 RepID=A0A1W1XSF2_9NEIS|nr:site-specific recombinase [Andreprevotia lacus]SMC26481.1 Site-specific recombinase [Andreprevotia lacus DSM 23236]